MTLTPEQLAHAEDTLNAVRELRGTSWMLMNAEQRALVKKLEELRTAVYKEIDDCGELDDERAVDEILRLRSRIIRQAQQIEELQTATGITP